MGKQNVKPRIVAAVEEARHDEYTEFEAEMSLDGSLLFYPNRDLTYLQLCFAHAAARSRLTQITTSRFEVSVPTHEALTRQVQRWAKTIGEDVVDAVRRGGNFESPDHLAWIISARVIPLPYLIDDSIRATVARQAVVYANQVWNDNEEQPLPF